MTKDRPITGRTAAALFVGMFGIIIGVNVFMAFMAVSTFPGLENETRFSRSQKFDDLRVAQDALGWNVAVRIEGQALHLSITDDAGRIVHPAELRGLFGRTTSTREDQQLQWQRTAEGYVAPVRADDGGNWSLRLNARSADGVAFQRRFDRIDMQG